MQNNNFDSQKLDQIAKASGGKIDKTALNDFAKSGKADSLMKKLSANDREKINNMLKNPEALKQMLKSPQAAAIMKMLSSGGKNE